MSARFSEPLVLFTGLPGSGKTLSAITYSVEARGEGQRIFQVGIRDCNERVAELWCPVGCDAALLRGDPRDSLVQAERLKAVMRWRELPSGAVLILDEAQDFFPVRGPGRPPDWMADLAKVRHFGVQIWMCTQDPRNIDAFVRRLIGVHMHIERKSGSKSAVTYTWPKVKDDTDDYHARKSADKGALRHKKEFFQYYTSATQHLIKRKIPWQLYLVIPIFIAVVVCGYFAVRVLTGHSKLSESPSKSSASSSGSGLIPSGSSSSSNSVNLVGLSPSDYAAKLSYRFPTKPWSAPIFDDRKAAAQPEIYCVDVEGGECRCYTEQMTRIAGVPNYQCRIVARQGSYNPFRAPMGSTVASAKGDQLQSRPVAGSVGPSVPVVGVQAPTAADASVGLVGAVGPSPLPESFVRTLVRPLPAR